ncbi:MAG: Fic family protein [Patescibacteria group bacterium]
MDSELRDFLARFIFESDAIEGISNDQEFLRRQLEKKHPTGHVGAFLTLEKSVGKPGVKINRRLVCQIQGLITAEQHLKPGADYLPREFVGKYRLVDVSIAGRIAPDCSLVPGLMDNWLNGVNAIFKLPDSVGTKELIGLVARAHFDYEFIHPFADGNGRSGRALVYFMLRRLGLKPFVFTAHDRSQTYYQCFDNPKAMVRYFLERSL